jgi:hypothetical protein
MLALLHTNEINEVASLTVGRTGVDYFMSGRQQVDRRASA